MGVPSGLFFLTGFEHQTISSAGTGGTLFGAVSGTPTINTTVNRAGGAACMQCDSTATAHSVQTSPSINTATIAVTRFYLRIDSGVTLAAPVGNIAAIVAQFSHPNGNFRLQLFSDYSLEAYSVTANTGQFSNIILESDRWYRIDLYCDVSTGTATLDWMIDGVPQTRQSATQASANFTSLIVGNGQGAASSRSKLYIDDWIVSVGVPADYPIGPGFIYGHVPVAVGTHSLPADFQNNSGASLTGDSTSWNLIDEWPANTTDYVQQITSSTTAYVEYKLSQLPNRAEKVGWINGIRALSALFNLSSTLGNNQRLHIFDGTTDTADLWSATIGATTLIYKGAIVPKPTSGSYWKPDDFISQNVRYRWGFSSDVSPIPFLSAGMVEVDYATMPTEPQVHFQPAVNRSLYF